MTPEQEKINETRYDFILDATIYEDKDLFITEGMNNKGLFYDVFRFSDGKLLMSSTNDISNLVVFPRKTHDFGTVTELREKGYPLENLFYAVIEAPGLPNSTTDYYK